MESRIEYEWDNINEKARIKMILETFFTNGNFHRFKQLESRLVQMGNISPRKVVNSRPRRVTVKNLNG